ncbi:MAG: hypothetical protein K2X38_10870 [Gemmataceae bacterium]|nr:hypothetical protein [Gemmataceae bacterium]
MRGTRHIDRRCRLWVESLEARTTPTAMPVPPMPPQPTEVVIFVGPMLPRITLPIEIRIDLQTEKPATSNNVSSATAADNEGAVSASAIAAAMRQAVAMTTQAMPALPRIETPPVFPVETQPPTESNANRSEAAMEEMAALIARLGSAAEPSPGDIAFNWVVPAHIAYWQRPVTSPTAEPEAVRGVAAPSAPDAEVAPAVPMAVPAPATSPEAESRYGPSEAEPLEVKQEAVAHQTKQTLTARMRWAGLLFLGWLKKPRRGARRGGWSRVELGLLAPGR